MNSGSAGEGRGGRAEASEEALIVLRMEAEHVHQIGADQGAVEVVKSGRFPGRSLGGTGGHP